MSCNLIRIAFYLIVTLGLSPRLGAAAYPKVEPEKAFSELKIYDAKGSPVRAARQDWTGARRRIADDAAWAEWLANERATVDRWIEHHRDRVSWVAGWSNDFVSPKDGSQLTWTEAIPGEEVDHFSSPSDPRVEITPKLTAAWVRTWREHHADMMQRAASLYKLTGNDKYANWAADQLDFYATHYLEWQPQRQGARLFWQSLTEGVNLITYAQTVRLLGDFATDDRRRMWFDKFFLPEVKVLNENFPEILNITCWLRGAAAQVALIFDDKQMWHEAIDGPFGVRQQVADGITSDYLWYEQSLGYNSYVVHALASLFETAGLYDRSEELSLEMATVENLMLSTTYMRFPNGQLPTPSDTKRQLLAPDVELFADLYRTFPTPLGLERARTQHNWQTLLDPPAGEPAKNTRLPEVTSRNFESSRMAVLKEGPWQVFFHYGQPPIKSHLQAEVLNYSVFYGGTDITHDTGTVGYGSPLHSEYYIQGLNHNVPLVNGEGQEQPPKGRKPDPFSQTRAGQLIQFSPEPALVSASHPVYRHDAKAQRTLKVEGDKLIDVAEIETTSDKPQQLGLALHLQGKATLPDGFEADPGFSRGRPKAFSYWTDVRTATFHDSATFTVDYGSLSLLVTVEVPGEFHVWHASTPDAPPDRREGFYFETLGTKATFHTLLQSASK